MPLIAAAVAAGAAEAGQEEATHEVETIDRVDFVEEFIDRMEPGEHTLFVGPTGRGKSTLMRDLLDAGPPIPNVGILMPKGADDQAGEPFYKMGHVGETWPEGFQMAWNKWNQRRPPYIWQQVGNPRAGYKPLRAQFEPTLQWARGRRNWLWLIPDLQSMSDRKFANCGGDVEWLTLTLRKFKSSIWMDTQRPAWIPRAAEDQVTNVVIFKNTDLGTVERLHEVMSLPMQTIVPLIHQMGRHDFLWLDGPEDDVFFVRSD